MHRAKGFWRSDWTQHKNDNKVSIRYIVMNQERPNDFWDTQDNITRTIYCLPKKFFIETLLVHTFQPNRSELGFAKDSVSLNTQWVSIVFFENLCVYIKGIHGIPGILGRRRPSSHSDINIYKENVLSQNYHKTIQSYILKSSWSLTYANFSISH